MCGLAGELNFGSICDVSVLQKMLSVIQYRGPDSCGTYNEGPIGFAHARLAIIDLSSAGSQPMCDFERDLVLVFNGVIYNYRELRRQLTEQGYHFFSHSDTEVILKAYHYWGDSCVQHLDGIFAIAIWDRRHQTLFLARDRFGIKPLYYTQNQKYFRFASSPQALIAAGGVDTDIDPVALHHHLTLHAVVPAPRTLLKGVKKLKSAHYLTVHVSGAVKISRYWQLKPKLAVPSHEEEWLTGLETELTRAIKIRYEVADVPTGVLLSGGLDSSLLVSLLSRLNIKHLNTYSVGFEDHGGEQGDEFQYSDLVASHYATNHCRFKVENDLLFECLPNAVKYMAEPMVGQDCIAFYLLAERVSQDIKVVQTGQGADEVFGGYFWYALMDAAEGEDIDRFRQFYFDRTHKEFLAGVGPDYQIEDMTTPLIADLLKSNRADSFINTVLSMDATTLIVDDPVKRVDNMTMAWGLEARVPFLDRSVVEYALAMPASLKLRGGGKYLLKQLAYKVLPKRVIDRPKAYFPVPALRHISGQFLHMAHEVLNSDACIRRGLFNRDYVRTLLSAPDKNITLIKGNKLWHYVLLEMWLQEHIDGSGVN